MRYILPPDALDKILKLLSTTYQEKTGVDFSVKPSFFGMPTLLGGTAVPVRKAQINFLEKIISVYRPQVMEGVSITTATEHSGIKIIMAACLYIKSQISRPKNNSNLYCLINEYLGINTSNFFDEEDKMVSILTALRVLRAPSALDEANAILKGQHKELFTDEEWRHFSGFTGTFCADNDPNSNFNYSFTSVIAPATGEVFAYAGAAAGSIGGEVLSKSTHAMASHQKATALIGGAMFAVNPSSQMGVALFSQVVASRLVTTYCSISLAHIMASVMRIVGRGVGMGIGLPLDASYYLLYKFCSMIANYNVSLENPTIGLRVTDGVFFAGATACSETPPTGLLEVKEDQLLLDGKPLPLPVADDELTPEMEKELEECVRRLIGGCEEEEGLEMAGAGPA